MSATRPDRSRRLRLMPEDWVQAALEALAAGGLRAVAIEPLAREMGVTKGSFYHHYPNLDALVDAMLATWEREGTDAVIATLESVPEPRERLRRLISIAWDRLDHLHAEAAFAASASAGDPRVAPVVRRVGDKRLAYMRRLYRALGLSERRARHAALHAYASYLGTVTLVSLGAISDDRELARHIRYLEEALLPR